MDVGVRSEIGRRWGKRDEGVKGCGGGLGRGGKGIWEMEGGNGWMWKMGWGVEECGCGSAGDREVRGGGNGHSREDLHDLL